MISVFEDTKLSSDIKALVNTRRIDQRRANQGKNECPSSSCFRVYPVQNRQERNLSGRPSMITDTMSATVVRVDLRMCSPMGGRYDLKGTDKK